MQEEINMKKVVMCLLAFLFVFNTPVTIWSQSDGKQDILPIDNLLRISSVAGNPQWTPDGKQIIFSSG